MRKLILSIIIAAVLSVGSAFTYASDETLTSGEADVLAVKQFYATGAGAISTTFAPQKSGTNLCEIVSIELHLSAAGGAANFTVTRDSILGTAYDLVYLTQDMTSVVDLFQIYSPGEFIFDSQDELDFAWANGSSRTYGLTVKYKLR